VHWTAHHPLQAVTHGRDVGRDVDGIGDQQHDHQRVQHRRGEVLPDIVGQAAPGDAPRRALITCTATIDGLVTTTVQPSSYPDFAPASE
jgi:hypothetical protein